MKDLRTNLTAKALAVLLLVLVSAGGFWASIITVARWNDLWSGGDFYDSATLNGHLTYDADRALELAGLYLARRWEGELNYRDAQRLQSLTQSLSADSTNFRFQIHDQQVSSCAATYPTGSWMGRYAVL